MQVDYEQIKACIKACDEADCLEAALEQLKSANSQMTKEEAIIRMLIDLRKGD